MKNFVSSVKNTHLLISLCLLGFLVRLTYVFVSPSALRFDEPRYWAEITNLLESWTFFDGTKYAHDMPLTALILAVFIKFSGSGLIGCKIFLASVSSFNIYLIGRISFLLVPSRVSLFLAGFISAVYPFFIYYSSLILSETFFLLLVSAYFLQLLKGKEQVGGWKMSFFAGLSHLVRPTLMYFMPVVWLWQVVVMKVSLKKSSLILIGFIIIIIPWGVRNKMLLGDFVVGSTGLGMVLLDGNNTWNSSGGTTSELVGYKKFLEDMPEGLGEIQTNNWQKKKAIDFIKAYPYNFIKLCWKKFLRFWHLWPNFHWFNHGIYKWISLLSFGPILLLSIASLWFLRHEWKKTGIIWIFFSYYTCVHIITVGSIRYRLPLEPLMIALACATIAKLTKLRSDKNVALASASGGLS